MNVSDTPVAGYATAAATREYARTVGADCPPENYSDFGNPPLKLSSLGLGTFPGAASDAVDADYTEIVQRAVGNGINVIDSAAHYRYGRSLRAVGVGLRRAFEAGVRREHMFLISKGGFLAFDSGIPPDLDRWFEREIIAKRLGVRADLSQVHLISPAYIEYQLDHSLR
ncbi:MAG: aldo/keto reductase, partial [Burkholderiales bacterium]